LNPARHIGIAQKGLACVAVLFGLATIFAGTRVLVGFDPGYIVFQPLLIYNIAMGMAYVAAGIIAWRSSYRGMYAAVIIFGLNFIVLGAISYLYTKGSAIAVDSLHAMTLRTLVWLALFVGLAWISRRN
jgi:hypothetical protein